MGGSVVETELVRFERLSGLSSVDGTMSIAPIMGFAADFDKDGDVDGEDFLIWQVAFPTLDGTATSNTGDANDDGDVDGEDFLIWQTEFGSGLAGLTAPEPDAALLGILAWAAIWPRRRRVDLRLNG